MNIDKQISIKTGGEFYLDIDELNFFQKKLKSITKEKFRGLKESLKKNGIPLGFHVWKNEKTNQWDIMDGHHRYLALKEIRSEGYFVPPVPCNKVLAKTKKEAASIVLISNSKYAEISQESLADFMIDFELTVEDLEFQDFPDIDFSVFEGNDLQDISNNEIPDDIKSKYSDKINTPIYSPKKDKPPEFSELFSIEKYSELINEINNQDITDEVKSFLIMAASRHIVFNYENIAEFYCHQDENVQNLMEKSALIIIDFNKAVENGFVKLTEELQNIYEQNDEESE